MALLLLSRLLLIFSLSLLAIGGAHARPGLHFHPCKTLYVSSYTISTIDLQNPNPNPNSNDNNPPRFFTIFDFYPSHPQPHHHQQQQPLELFLDRRPLFDFESNSEFARPQSFPSEKASHPLLPYNTSFGERTKDILSVVVALLFGVGCGALTSATMYLAWSLITSRYQGYDDFTEDDFSEDDFSPKKVGYCKIPDEVPAKTDSAAAATPPAAKEVV